MCVKKCIILLQNIKKKQSHLINPFVVESLSFKVNSVHNAST